MKIAILGGSFNPVHIGHLFLADAVLAAGYDRVILVPAYQSPFKIGDASASPDDRLDMLCASIAGDSRITVDACEIQRQGISYTIDTIADIKKRYLPDGKPGLILGDDLIGAFHLWHNASDIPKEADIIIASRLNTGRLSADFPYFEYPHTVLNNEIMNNSSSEVREKIAADGNWRYLVPAGARQIIEDRGLYGLEKRIVPVSHNLSNTVHFENIARLTLTTERFMHSRHTAIFAHDLCVRFNLDPAAGYLAGITHDLCKGMSDEKMLELAKSDGETITRTEKEFPGLLHGRAAAVLLKTCYNLHNEEILEAVRHHVKGGTHTGPLAKILYIADKIEVSRFWVEPKYREMNRTAGLDDLFNAVREYIVSWLEKKGINSESR